MNDKGSCLIKMVTSAIILHHGDDSNRTNFIPSQANDTILAWQTQEVSEEEASLFNNAQMLEELTVNKRQKIADETQKKFTKLEEAKVANSSFDKESW